MRDDSGGMGGFHIPRETTEEEALGQRPHRPAPTRGVPATVTDEGQRQLCAGIARMRQSLINIGQSVGQMRDAEQARQHGTDEADDDVRIHLLRAVEGIETAILNLGSARTTIEVRYGTLRAAVEKLGTEP